MTGRIIFGLILIAIGISSLTDISIFKFVISLIFLWIGFNIITGRRDRWHNWGGRFHKDQDLHVDDLNEVYVFSGADKRVISDNFAGGKVVCVFGGSDLDLSDVKPAENVIDLEVVCVFGGTRLKIPQNWMVKTRNTSVIGGIDNRTRPTKGSRTQLRLRGSAVFGGIEIYN